MNQVKTLLREILGELRQVNAELVALREQLGEQYPQFIYYELPEEEKSEWDGYEVTWTGDSLD